MILMYDKKTLGCRWFRDVELDVPDGTTGYTEKKPPDARYYWGEDQNEWCLSKKYIWDAEKGDWGEG